jgi:hypothetical protein
VDALPRDAAAFYFAAFSRERLRVSDEHGDPARCILGMTNEHDFTWASVKKMSFPLAHREFAHRYIAYNDELEGALVVCFDPLPVETEVDYGAVIPVVRATTRGIIRFKDVGDDQCEVTMHQYLDAGGWLPEKITVKKIPRALGAVSEMRDVFERDDEIDEGNRRRLMETLLKPQTYSKEENDVIDNATRKFAELGGFKDLTSPDKLVNMDVVFVPGETTGVLRGRTIVDAPIAEVAAWEMSKMSRENLKIHRDFGGLEKGLEWENEHKNVYQVVYTVPLPGFDPREFCVEQVWKWKTAGELMLAARDTGQQRPIDTSMKKYVVGSSTAWWVYKSLEATGGGVSQTQVTYTQHVDMRGALPGFIQNTTGVGMLMYLSDMRLRFDHSVPVDQASRDGIKAMLARHTAA